MADLGDVVGSLMVGLIRARRMADEQTAALAEYYRTNPLLEGLSVPRIRIPELTVDLPVLIENHELGQPGEMGDAAKIAATAHTSVKATLQKFKVPVPTRFQKTFVDEAKKSLSAINPGTPVMQETIARSLQTSLASALAKEKITLTSEQKEGITRDLRSNISTAGISREPATPKIEANIKTADVKEQGTTASVVRLQITMKEEGLEWAVQSDENGGVTRTLTPE